MKKWRCKVCNFVHTGNEPPEECPVCKAEKSQFILMEESSTSNQSQKSARWRCTVCGYIHEGDNPPEKCPVCGVLAEKFEKFEADGKERYNQLGAYGPNGKKLWQCNVCLYIYEGDEPPVLCPRCWAPQEYFIDMSNPKPIPDPYKPDTTDALEADILVVGTGAAGFSAAITAKNLGNTVIMLEKSGVIGGTTRRSGGGFWIPVNRHQKAKGIQDNHEDAILICAVNPIRSYITKKLSGMGFLSMNTV